jgi:hypothetical protein
MFVATGWFLCCRPYAEKAKWTDPEAPSRLLRELFAKYVPATIFEMRKSFSHIVPLGAMNFVGTLCSILEVREDGNCQQQARWVRIHCSYACLLTAVRLPAGPPQAREPALQSRPGAL